MKRLLIILLMLLVPSVAMSATYYSWRYLSSADCSAEATGKLRDLCYDTALEQLFKCVPSAGDCDTAAEWKEVGGTIDGAGSAGTVAIWSAGTTLTYDDDFSFSGATLTVAGTVNVDASDGVATISANSGALTFASTVLIDSGDSYGSAISFDGTTTDDGCDTWGEGSIFYNTTDDVFCFCNTTTSIRMATTASCFE